MIDPEFILKQVEQTKKASEILANGQKELDAMFGGVLSSLKSKDPKKANELKKIMSMSDEVMKRAKEGDMDGINELINKMKNEKRKS